MAGFYGADTEQLRSFQERVQSGGSRLTDMASQLSSTVLSVEWIGPDADSFRNDFSGRVNSLFDAADGLLNTRRTELGEHADEQDEVSDPADGSFLDSLEDLLANPLTALASTLKDIGSAGAKLWQAFKQGRSLLSLAQAVRAGGPAAQAAQAFIRSGMLDDAAGFFGKLGSVGRFGGGALGLFSIYSGISDMINPPHDGWRGAGDRVAGFLGAVGGAGSLAVMLGAGAALGPVGLGIVAGAGAVAALWTAGNAIYDNWDSITGAVSDFGGAVSDFASDAGDAISGAVDGVGDFIGGLF